MTAELGPSLRRATTALYVTLMSTSACDVGPRGGQFDVDRSRSTAGLTTASYLESHPVFSGLFFAEAEIASDATYVILMQTLSSEYNGAYVELFTQSPEGLVHLANPGLPIGSYNFPNANFTAFYGSARDTIVIDGRSVFMGDPNAPGISNANSIIRVFEVTDDDVLVQIDE